MIAASPAVTSPTLDTLARAAAHGGNREFETLATACRPLIIAQVERIGIRSAIIGFDDLVQMSLIAVYEALGTWQPTLSSFGTFCRRVVRCHLLSAIRSRNAWQSMESLDGMDDRPAKEAAPTMEDLADMRDESSTILHRMKPRDAFIIQGIAEGFSYADVGEVIGLTDRQIHSIIQRRRRHEKKHRE